MLRALLLATFVFACGNSKKSKPAGTAADPVEVCEQVAQICRYKGSQLGVCTHSGANNTLVCEPQH